MRQKSLAAVLALTVAALAAAVGANLAVADDPAAQGAAGGGATASHSEVVLRRGYRGPAVARVQRRLGVATDGVFGRLTERAVKRFQRGHGLDADGVVGPLTRRALRLRPFRRAEVRRSSTRTRIPAVLRRIAECESGGDPRAIGGGGRYRGKYQFMRSTWRGLGGRGDPARAPEWLQDRLALKLYRRSGVEPWGACGRAALRG